MKQRFSSLDVKVIAHELHNALLNLRLANAYDLSPRIFLLKFARPDNREQLVLDCGFRCHLTSFARTTYPAPTPFVERLRKYLRSRRVTAVRQVGTDRIIEIEFSEGGYRLFLEFYAGGNIVLTDKGYTILAVFRVVSAEESGGEVVKVGLKYSLESRQNFGGIPELTIERLRDGLEKATGKKGDADPSIGKRGKKGGADSLRKALAVSITEYPPMLVEHALRVSKFDTTLRPEDVLGDNRLLEKLLIALGEAERVVKEITSSKVAKGYIFAKPTIRIDEGSSVGPKVSFKELENSDDETQQDKAAGDRSGLLYEDFHPFLPLQIEEDPSVRVLIFEGFNNTVDEFFSSIEGQKLESRLRDREETAKKKLDAARKDHEKRIDSLQETQQLNVRKAEAIEANHQKVEEVMAVVNNLIAQGMDWVEIARLIEMEQARKNPLAQMIKLPLKLYENTATIWLPEARDDEVDFEGDETDSEVEDSEGEGSAKKETPKKAGSMISVDVDLGLTAWANARQYYDQKRTAAVKEQKTIQSSSKALKSTEKKITAELKKGLKQEKRVLRPVRKQLWFEKFYFFISSDGYLVLGGRDAQQNEMLYKRHLKRGDVYIHADIHGAATVIIKNNPNTPDAPIPPATLAQAGTLSVASSKAWDSKAGLSAWWVNSDQVSKTAPTGEYLTTGGFMIRGKKNFLPPAQLLLGFAVMFQISEESKARHVKHRLNNPDDESVAESSTTAVAESEVTAVNAEASERENDSDEEDFPDAKLESGSEDEEEDSDDDNPQVPGPPKPPRSKPALDVTETGEDADESEDDSEDGGTTGDESRLPKQEDAETGRKGGTRHLSAKERRLLRKSREGSAVGGFTPEPQSTDVDSRKENFEVDKLQPAHADSGTSGRNTPNPTAQQQRLQVRGKRGKQRKLATKYANQDEEDRAFALKFLGSATAREKAEDDAKTKKAKEEELAAQKQRRREQHLKAAAQGKEEEEIRRVMHEENLEVLNDEEEEKMTLLDSFIGTPLPGDEILEAIPVCAPWTALGRYKYKAKLQPGIVKKGKAVREIQSGWIREGERRGVDVKAEDVDKMWPREAELIKGWKDGEMTNAVPVGKMKILMAGGGGGGTDKGGSAKDGRGKGKSKAGKGKK